MRSILIILLCVLLLAACSKGPRIQPIESLSPTRTSRPTEEPTATPSPPPIPMQRVDESGTTVFTRFNPVLNYTRQATEPGTFSAFLQNLPLMAAGSQVIAHDDTVREKDDYDAVLSLGVTGKNEQGAGAVAHLRAQYFFAKQEYDKISFKLTDGFDFGFDKWRQGNRLTFVDNRSAWKTGGTSGESEENYEAYLEMYFAHSGFRSLKTDMTEVDVTDPVRIGDVFVTEGDNGRVIVVADCATDEASGRHVILIEGGKPAQPMRVLQNALDSDLSPWFAVDAANGTITLDEEVTLRLEPYEGGPARYKFYTDSV